MGGDYQKEVTKQLNNYFHYYNDSHKFIATFCPFCDCQRHVSNIALVDSVSDILRYVWFNHDGDLIACSGWHCPNCDTVFYKDISESLVKYA